VSGGSELEMVDAVGGRKNNPGILGLLGNGEHDDAIK
jgi:hypothetical protein